MRKEGQADRYIAWMLGVSVEEVEKVPREVEGSNVEKRKKK